LEVGGGGRGNAGGRRVRRAEVEFMIDLG
jgi:hypothetical protein